MSKSKHPLRDLLLVFTAWLASLFFAGSLFEVYFLNLGMSLHEIYLADVLWFLGAVLLIPLFKGFKTKPFILFGIGMTIVSVLALLLIKDPSAAYIFRFFLGTTHFFFWVPFNTAVYEFRKENNATLSSILTSFTPLLSLVLPAVSGIIAQDFGYDMIYVASIVCCIIAIIIGVFLIENRTYKYDFRKSMKSISGLKSLLFLDGFSISTIGSVTLPIMLLGFLDKPQDVGFFLSLVTVFAIVSSFFVSYASDKSHGRRKYLFVSALGFSLAAIFSSQVSDILLFFIGFGLVNFFSKLFSPLSAALAVDNTKKLADTIAAREFMLNLGRFSGGIIGIVIFLMYDLQATLLFQGAFFLIYIPIFELKRRKLLHI